MMAENWSKKNHLKTIYITTHTIPLKNDFINDLVQKHDYKLKRQSINRVSRKMEDVNYFFKHLE